MRRALPAAALGLGALLWALRPHLGLAHVTTTNTVVFEREIVGILDQHCVACHATGAASPSLSTYEEVWVARERILRTVLEGAMPPWGAVAGYGGFSNANGLTATERQFVVSWVEGLGPRNAGELFLNVVGGAANSRPLEASADTAGWALGEPDATITLPHRRVPASDGLRMERVVFESGEGAAGELRALEFRPGSRRAVHAAHFYLEPSGAWIGSWTPWRGFLELPEGVTWPLAPGARIAADILYGPVSEEFSDEGVLGLSFVDGAETSTRPTELLLEARETQGVPGGQRLHVELPVAQDSRIFALLPELDSGLRSLEVSIRRPDGGTEVLLYLRDPPAEWPTPYLIREPVTVPAGSILRATAYSREAVPSARPVAFRLRVTTYAPTAGA